MKVYNKLVRDRIPEIIERSGQVCSAEILSESDYLQMLDAKLNEECAEYQESKELEELADIMEVIYAIASARGSSPEALEAIRKKKEEERGGFAGRILLRDVRPCVEKTER